MKRCLGCMEIYEDGYQVCPWCGYVEGTPAEEKIHMDPGMPLHGRYVIGRVLGYGGFGVTYLAWDTVLEQKVAIKEYLPGEFSTRMPGSPSVTVFGGEKSQQFFDGLRKFVDEARRLARFTSEPGVVRIFDSFEENGTAYIVMEYLEGETLKDYLQHVGTVSEDEAIRLLTPVMRSLEAVHAEGILHRDIAPDNIFLTNDGEVKLIDFGASRYATTSHSRSLTVIIKPGYSAEEQYRSRGDQGPHTDVYSLGATLYRMITGKTPPDAMERRAKYENQNRDILIPPHVVLKEQKSRQRLSVDRENAILNALNVRIEDRTPDVGTLLSELYSEKPVKRRQGKIKRLDLYTWPLWLKILIPTLLAALVTVGVLLVTGVINLNKYTTVIELPANTVEVPALVNKTSEEARALLSECSLGSSITSIEDENLPVNVVLRQDPPQGAFAAVNSNVNLVVSKGKGAQTAVDGVSTVPYLIGSTKETALADLKTAGLTAEIAEAFSDEFEAGIVMAQSLNAGEQVDEGTKITITVSKGGETFALPNVTGKAMADADAELKALGLQVVIEQRADANVPVGQVIEQATAAGTPVKKGDSVTLTVSSGVPTAAVPNVVGMTEAQANRALANAGFAYAVAGSQYSANAAAGTVLTQNPAANSVQAYGTQINLILSLGAEPEPEPVEDDPVEEPPAPQTPVQANWSEWADSMPGYVTNADYEIDRRTLYSYRDMETTSSTTQKTMSGWELYDTVDGTGDFGPWSEWSQTAVAPAQTREVETQTRYRYRDKETTTSTSSSMSGWTLDSSDSAWGGYGAWSDWSTTAVSKSDSRDVESKTQYRYRDISYTTEYTAWGSWSDWQNNAVSSDDLTNVQTRTAYYYYYYLCPNCGAHMHLHSQCYTWADGCGYTGSDFNYNTIHTFYSAIPYSQASEFKGVGRLYSDKTEQGRAFAWYKGGLDYHDPITQYRYQKRSTTQSPSYGSWSNWSDTPYSSSSSREVQTRTVYRYRDRTQTTTYYYSRWGEWSAWSANAVTQSNTRDVETATFYRYRDRVTQTTYYFRRWSAWSQYSETPASKSETREVQTKTQYRFKSR